MDKNYIADLIDRLRQSSTPPNLREEVIRVIKHQQNMLQDVHNAARGGSLPAAVFISGVALGKPGYEPGDVGF
jgi:hypothetical protein